MATWRDMTVQQARAARELADEGVLRPSVSRAYYAAYSAVTHALHAQGVRRFGARANPDHADVPALVLHTLHRLDVSDRRTLSTGLRRLRASREDADYRPRVTFTRMTRARAVWDMNVTLRFLGIES